MKKLTNSVLVVVLSSSFVFVNAQKKQDSTKTKDIEGVVVTALGIKREKKALGYSTQEVKAEDLARNPVTNFTAGLSGKVSGLQVKGVGNFAGSVDVVLRGYRSILGQNSPLYVIDGVPIINANNNTSGQLNGSPGYDFGNTVSDINPNDIADINVLKGAAATALYGSRAQNGAIIITTKKGKKSNNIGIEYNSSIAVSAIDKSTFVTYQKEYGQGQGYVYGFAADKRFENYNGERMAPTQVDASYGAKFDPNLLVWQYGAFIPGSRTFGQKTPWVAAKHDPSYFFQTGAMYTNDVSLSQGNDKGSFRLSYQNQNGTDVLPNSKLNKNTVNGSATYKFTDKLNATFNATYVSQQVTGRNNTGYSGNLISGFRQWWPVNVDIYDQRDFYNMSQNNYSWNITNGNDITPQYWNNPYFQRYQNFSYDTRERFAGNFSLSYDVDKHINLLARVGTDGYTTRMEDRKAIGSIASLMGFGRTTATQPSGFAVMNIKQRETNYDFIATYKNDFENEISLTGLLGTNLNVRDFYSNSQSTSGGLLIPGVYTVANSASVPAVPQTIDITKRIIGVFAQASLGYKGTYYLEGTVRRDQSSALPTANSAYWYYSGSGSLVFSNWSFLKGGILSFGKLRASYAEVGSDTDANQLLNQYYVTTSFNNLPVYYYTTGASNPNLRPERSRQTELGLNMKFLKSRIGIDVAWFKNDSYDQILALPYSNATGISTQVKNVGNLRTKGWEISLDMTPIKTENFKWDINANWSNPYTNVTSLADGVENITMGTYQGGVTINASLQDPYGTIKGKDFVYTNGQRTVGSNGKYVLTSTTNNVIGNIQAKWFGGITNTFTYKSFSVGFQIDVKQGGNVFSLDQYYGQTTGLYPESVGINDLGNPIRNTIANGGGIILPGVLANGTPNNIRLDTSANGYLGYSNMPNSVFVYDASFVKLRQASISYSLPKKMLENTFIQGVTFSAIGNNLWIIKKHVPYADPEAGLSSGNSQGFQSGVMPATRVFSFNVKVNF
ncbi:SusC/RagA family TonB-linked outer membrane protein [Elizabethkingia miricola]|uniref:SusC/RagA family TonB-linked outer membrane protein n=1 Tax=Elizabethkingia miricola TaxID=172045 RepID=A0AAP1BW89_ELIMR|nr:MULTISPECIES: SusC/RagA family TonB-linked outer membrane protein [Elizabethkingia]KUY19644.1 SusC/RagA family TonB-linked outer membrane protein [Elizabethkingia miricola]MCL1651273.1 SusC/RagA family TonB-linked outer membrane protein [Elizabethkingia miricola]MCL1678396.1 SusC/RagA family TonB-linked outer membrane protein [Elizabethkingia miricola]OPC14371.1 SusC/RagA family TonB-linked outer membrane protein [Elizabethkingia miricola]OPC32631.1 SusC/RagA family TonB-linked outer membra